MRIGLGTNIGLVAGAVQAFGGTPVPYLGQIATRSYVPLTTNAGIPQSMARSKHIARDTITSLQIEIPNWYVNNTTFAETGVGASASVTASIEYPAATFTQVKFSGIAAGTVPDLTTLRSDVLPIAIPKGATFFVRIWRNCAGGIVFTGSVAQDTSNGDFFRYGSSITDQTMSGTITSSDTSNMAFPCAIIANTRMPACALTGDSRVAGLNDTFSDATGDKGELARAIGPLMAYINMGVPSDQAQKFVASHARRQALLAYVTTQVIEYGINDLATGGRSDAQIRADLLSIAGYAPGKRNILCTMPPSTTGAWTLANGSDQTVKSFEASRVSNNDWRRTVPAGFNGCFEIADVVESSRNSGKWKADGTPAKYTSDGVHESNFACQAIRDSGAIVPSLLTR